jgi:hypothetical protein
VHVVHRLGELGPWLARLNVTCTPEHA